MVVCTLRGVHTVLTFSIFVRIIQRVPKKGGGIESRKTGEAGQGFRARSEACDEKNDEEVVSMQNTDIANHILQAKLERKTARDIRQEHGVNYFEQISLLNTLGAEQCVREILRTQGAGFEFPHQVLEEASARARAIPLAELHGRADFRDKTIFTIDCAETRDMDDAVSIRCFEGGYELGVHIADVSSYVTLGSELEKEAFRRGTSLYYANSDIPMLPPALSKGVCSLFPDEERLAFSCLLNLDTQGRLINYRFVKSVIRSRLKGVYTEINALLEGSAVGAVCAKYAPVVDSLLIMRELYEKLAVLRERRDAIVFEADEVALLFDDTGKCCGLRQTPRGISEKMIEEFMLLANQAATLYAKTMRVPFIYRNHPAPSEVAMESLNKVLAIKEVDYRFNTSSVTTAEIKGLLRQTEGRPYAQAIQKAALRSMSKAVYEPKNTGHYALNLASYTHFTSPIRRYADLAVHRILSDAVAGLSATQITSKYDEYAEEAAAQSTDRERYTAKLERKVLNCYKAEYSLSQRGQSSEGIVIGSKDWGLEVLLSNSVFATMSTKKLPGSDWSNYENIQLRNPRGEAFTIGDTVGVCVESASVFDGRTNLELSIASA